MFTNTEAFDKGELFADYPDPFKFEEDDPKNKNKRGGYQQQQHYSQPPTAGRGVMDQMFKDMNRPAQGGSGSSGQKK